MEFLNPICLRSKQTRCYLIDSRFHLVFKETRSCMRAEVNGRIRVCVFLTVRVSCRLLPHSFSRVCGAFVRQWPFWVFCFIFVLCTSELLWPCEMREDISHLLAKWHLRGQAQRVCLPILPHDLTISSAPSHFRRRRLWPLNHPNHIFLCAPHCLSPS